LAKAVSFHPKFTGRPRAGALKLHQRRIKEGSPLFKPKPDIGCLFDIAGRAAVQVFLLAESFCNLQARLQDATRCIPGARRFLSHEASAGHGGFTPRSVYQATPSCLKLDGLTHHQLPIAPRASTLLVRRVCKSRAGPQNTSK
jgi:hypothetical protein